VRLALTYRTFLDELRVFRTAAADARDLTGDALARFGPSLSVREGRKIAVALPKADIPALSA